MVRLNFSVGFVTSLDGVNTFNGHPQSAISIIANGHTASIDGRNDPAGGTFLYGVRNYVRRGGVDLQRVQSPARQLGRSSR